MTLAGGVPPRSHAVIDSPSSSEPSWRGSVPRGSPSSRGSGSAGAEVQQQDFSTPGTYQFVVPAGVTQLTIDVFGAKAAAAAASTAAHQVPVGGMGGEGEGRRRGDAR